MKVLISGAGVAGPVLAYWLTRRGFDATVVERAPALRKAGGHAVDLFRPAVEIAEQMGVLPQILARSTETTELVFRRPGARRAVRVDQRKMAAAMTDRHVEIMRDDLSQIFYDAVRNDAEFIFGDHITAISADGDIEFANGAPRRYDLVVGADGLHSGVRQLVFGPDAGHTRFLGGHLSVLSVPKSLARNGESTIYVDPGRLALIYTAPHLDDARAVFLFRPAAQLQYDHREIDHQKLLLHNAFDGMSHEIDRWLDHANGATGFYFDSITQLELTSWSRGRVTLVGDAGYCPGPAVGGSTSLAVLGAYVLAGELGCADGDYPSALAAYERVMREPVLRSRQFARRVSRATIPATPLGVRTFIASVRLISLLPSTLTTSIARLNDTGVRLYDSMQPPAYDPVIA